MGNNTSRTAGYSAGYPPTAYEDATQTRRYRSLSGRRPDRGYPPPSSMGYQQGYGQQVQPYPPTQGYQPPAPQIFQREQYQQYMQAPPAPPVGFPQPTPSRSRPVIPNVPRPNAPVVVPSPQPMRRVDQTHYPQPGAAMSMPQPVVPSMPNQHGDGAPVFPQMPQPTVMPEPVSFPEPQVNDSDPARERFTPGPQGLYDRRPDRFRPPTPPYNPLPVPPKDIFEFSPYMSMLQELRRPIEDSSIRKNIILPSGQAANVTMGAGYIPGSRRSHERRHRRKGSILNVFTRHRQDDDEDDQQQMPFVAAQPANYAVAPMMQQMPVGNTPFAYNPAPQFANVAMNGTVPVVSLTPMPMADPGRGPSPAAAAPRMATPAPAPVLTRPVMKVDPRNELAGLIHYSQHRVHYDHKSYPTAYHLHEALKFLGHRPEIAERIRACGTVEEVRAVSASAHEHVRPDWERVILDMMDDVLYTKMIQHPTLRSLLMSTGIADLVFADINDSFWGDGPLGQGANELGRALVRVRERLRAEGVGT